MTDQEWAEKEVREALSGVKPVKNGKILLVVELDYFNGSCGGMNINASRKETFRKVDPPKEDRKVSDFDFTKK